MAEYTREDVDVILQRMVDYYRTSQTKITDFNEGSEIRNLLSSVGISAYEIRDLISDMLLQRYPQTAEGDYLDMVGVLLDCNRKPATKSTGNLVFSLSTPADHDIEIPIGTIATSSDLELDVQSTAAATLLTGETTIIVPSEYTSGGTVGNIAAGIIDTLEEPLESLTVTNTIFEGGEDVEGDEEYRVRILDAGKGGILGSIAWYKFLSNAISGVHDTVVINNPFNRLFNVTLIINGEVKPTPDDVIEAVEAIFTDETKIMGGINVQVITPNYSIQDVIGTMSIDSDFNWATVLANVESNIADYFNGGITTFDVTYLGLNIANNIVRSRIEILIANTEGVIDYTLTTPASNVLMANNGAAQLGTITLTQV